MSTSWSDIEASGSLMRSTNEDVFSTTYDATLTSGSAVITMDNTVGIIAGHVVHGTGVVAGSVVLSIIENTSITIDNNVTDTGTYITITVDTTTDAQLAAKYKTEAKTYMYQDLWQAYSNNPDVATFIDDIADVNEASLEITLGYKQLAMYYTYNDDESGSINNNRKKEYQRLYQANADKFAGLKRTSSPTVYSGGKLI